MADIDYPLLPEQLPEGALHTPERKLMWAVLIDAIERVNGSHSPEPHHMGESELDALEWFMRPRQGDWLDLYSFESVCDHLGYDPESIRRGVLNSRRRGTWSKMQRMRRV